MKKTSRLKPSPLATHGEFIDAIDSLAVLETTKRKIEAEMELELQKIHLAFDSRLDPLRDRMKGQFALAADYAEAHRADLLPKDAKSVKTALAIYGWRTGNRTCALLSRVTSEHAIAALKALGLAVYVREKEEIARDVILNDCKDDKTFPYNRVVDGVMQPTLLSDAGLKIAQNETFFIEPTGEAAETLKSEAAA